jgi:TonB-linked SusC/RagA family outer membrane protein
MWAQSVSGTVLDEYNEPLPSVAVVLKDGRGTQTDFNGQYTLELGKGTHNITFSFIGYEEQVKTVVLDKSKILNVTMKPSNTQLDEVVVVGYGVARKRDLTGSVVSLKTKELTDIPTPSFENAIQGKAAGVQVITGSGIAGSGSMVRVRGVASISAGGDPLYVVDGIPITQDYFLNGNRGGFNTNPLATINPNDIESVEILKDAAATGIYGSRGSNGVVLITTKRGKSKKLSYNFSSRVGISGPTALPNMATKEEYLQLYEEAWVNDGNVGVPELPGNRVSWAEAQAFEGTDWVQETIRTGIKHGYDFSASRGFKGGNFYAGLSYNDNNSYLQGNSYERLSGRFNVDYNLASNLKMGVSTSLSRGVNNRIDAAWSGGFGEAMSRALPIYPVYYAEDEYDDNGNLIAQAGDYWLKGGVSLNPVAQRNLKDWTAIEDRTINNVTFDYKPSDAWTIRAQGAFDYMHFEDHIWEKPGYDPTYKDDEGNLLGRANMYPYSVWNTSGNATANYMKDFGPDHHFNWLIGSEYQYNRILREDGYYDSEATGQIRETGVWVNDPRSYLEEYAFASAFTRLNYNFKGKYYAEALIRRDGSSKFGPNNKYGNFPAASIGWIVSEESFMANSPFNYLKLKTSVGKNGNSAIPSYQWYGYFNVANNGYAGQTYRYPVIRENANLRWETSTTYDVGLEYGILNDRITGELAYYYKQTNDMLLNVTLQGSTGFGSWWDNVGSVYNTGVEFAIKSRNIVTDNFTWTTDFNIARNYNEITSIGQYSPDAVSGGTNDTRVVVGMPIGTNYLVRFSHVDPANGLPVYLDIDGNETYTWDLQDRVAVGNVMPDAVGGLTNTFNYKNYEFSFLWVFTIGGDIYDSSSKRQMGVVTDWNFRTDIFDRWQQPGDVATYPILSRDYRTYGANTEWINTNLWLHDGTYARLRNVKLSYRVPKENLKYVQGMSVNLTATNMITLTNFIGLDPEIARDFENATDRNMSPNITYLTPPQEKTLNVGVNINF